jgi:hypothetical protein
VAPSALRTAPVDPSWHEGGDNRLVEQADWIKSRLDSVEPRARVRLEETLEIEPHEATAYLEAQARAAARQILTSEEALTIYEALTPDGWEPGTRLEMKMAIATLMGSLVFDRSFRGA